MQLTSSALLTRLPMVPPSLSCHIDMFRKFLALVVQSFHQNWNKDLVCDVSQKAEIHQLPYENSSNCSSAPLELAYYDV